MLLFIGKFDNILDRDYFIVDRNLFQKTLKNVRLMQHKIAGAGLRRHVALLPHASLWEFYNAKMTISFRFYFHNNPGSHT